MGSPSYMATRAGRGASERSRAGRGCLRAGCDPLRALDRPVPVSQQRTMLETLEQVKTTEPVPSSRLVPGVPARHRNDLPQVSEKEPGKRYEAARALAEDVRMSTW